MRVISVTGAAVRVRPTAWVPIWARGPWIQPSHTATCPAGSAETSSSRVTGVLDDVGAAASVPPVMSSASPASSVPPASGASCPTGRQ